MSVQSTFCLKALNSPGRHVPKRPALKVNPLQTMQANPTRRRPTSKQPAKLYRLPGSILRENSTSGSPTTDSVDRTPKPLHPPATGPRLGNTRKANFTCALTRIPTVCLRSTSRTFLLQVNIRRASFTFARPPRAALESLADIVSVVLRCLRRSKLQFQRNTEKSGCPPLRSPLPTHVASSHLPLHLLAQRHDTPPLWARPGPVPTSHAVKVMAPQEMRYHMQTRTTDSTSCH